MTCLNLFIKIKVSVDKKKKVSYGSINIIAMRIKFYLFSSLLMQHLKHKCVRWLASKAACLLEGFPGTRCLRSCSDETQSREVAQRHIHQHTVAESVQSETGQVCNSINVVKANHVHIRDALINAVDTAKAPQ